MEFLEAIGKPAEYIIAIVGVIGLLWAGLKYVPRGYRWLGSRLEKKQQTSARPSDITITQFKGHGDNIQSTYRSRDSWLVLIRDLTVLNNTERDEVVSLKLWWPLNNGSVTFTPQRERPPNIPPMRLLNRVENIPARKSITGNLLFKLPTSTVPEISASFFIIIVTSQLTGIERAFNTLSFTEVVKPYPRTLEEIHTEKSQRCQKVVI